MTNEEYIQLYGELPPSEINENAKSPTSASGIKFPCEVFPPLIQSIIKATNDCLNYPADYISTSILFATSIAIGNTHRVQFKNGWEENALIYVANVGAPGAMKTPPMEFALKPIEERDTKSHHEYKIEKKEYDRLNALPQKEKPKDIIEPIHHKFILQDFTPEALAKKHEDNIRGISVCVDELGSWFKNFNRYHSSAEEQLWLSTWSKKSISIDRATKEPVHIPMPYIPVGGGIQPGILPELAAKNRNKNGLIDRILFSFPDNIEKQTVNDDELDIIYSAQWNKIIGKLLDMPLVTDDFGKPKPKILKLSASARAKFKEWHKGHHIELVKKTNEEGLKSIYSKFDIHCLRFALINELLIYATTESTVNEISIEAMNGAFKLCDYYEKNAAKVYAIISKHSPVEGLSQEKKKIYEALPNRFSTGDGIKIAEGLGMAGRTFEYFISNSAELFQKIKQGEYSKKY